MKTCGECPVFRPKAPDSYATGDGWCDVELPHDFQGMQWGRTKEAILKTRKCCSIGPLLAMAAALRQEK